MKSCDAPTGESQVYLRENYGEGGTGEMQTGSGKGKAEEQS